MKLAAVVDDTSEINLQEDSRSVTQRTRREKASSMVQKSLKELRVMRRRVAFGWRHLKAGVLVFQDGGGQRRTFAVGKKLGEGGYSTIWRVHEWQPDGSEKQFAVKRVILDRRDAEQVALVAQAFYQRAGAAIDEALHQLDRELRLLRAMGANSHLLGRWLDRHWRISRVSVSIWKAALSRRRWAWASSLRPPVIDAQSRLCCLAS